MTTERLQELKKSHNGQFGGLQVDEVNELIAFAETALPLMTPTNVMIDPEDPDTYLPRFSKAEPWQVAMPSRGEIAMHFYAALLSAAWGPKDAPTLTEQSFLHADAMIAELEKVIL